MENLCRLCSSQSTALTPVFSIKNGRLLLDMISLICPIKIDISDNLPKAICSLCLRIILDAVDLRERSILSDLSLRSRMFGGKATEIENTAVSQKPHDDESMKPIPIDTVKIETEKIESNVINYIDESHDSHEDYQQYDTEQSYGDELTDYAESEPPTKMQKLSYEQRCSNCQCHKPAAVNHELNEKIKEYFRKPLQKGGKWKCHICQKEYAGHLNNLKEHLSIMHKDIAQMLGVTMRIRQRKSEKLKNEGGKNDFQIDGNLLDYMDQKSVSQI